MAQETRTYVLHITDLITNGSYGIVGLDYIHIHAAQLTAPSTN
jgi:hypothetical protein